jgi:alpha-ribazole phosphatase
MNIYLIRHTKVATAKGICYGQTDVGLADSFKKESEVIKDQIKDIKFDKIYSSPLTRCKKLAKQLFKSEIIYDDRLMEMNFGEWELQEWDNIQHPDIDRWMTDFVNTPCPNGESFLQMHKRIISFITDIDARKYKNIAIISHGGPIRNFITHIKDEDLKDAFKREITYGEIIKLEV